MTHEDAGQYAAKHAGAAVNPDIAAQLPQHIAGGCITCAAAHAVARSLGAAPAQVGMAVDLLEARIIQCQLGLFGWDEGQKPVAQRGEEQTALRRAIEKALVDGRLPCAAAWAIARSLAVGKPAVAQACDGLGIKICRCQLGAFS